MRPMIAAGEAEINSACGWYAGLQAISGENCVARVKSAGINCITIAAVAKRGMRQ